MLCLEAAKQLFSSLGGANARLQVLLSASAVKVKGGLLSFQWSAVVGQKPALLCWSEYLQLCLRTACGLPSAYLEGVCPAPEAS